MIKVIGLGAGGHAKVVIEAARLAGNCEVVGLLDSNPSLHGQHVLGVIILGPDNMLADLFRNDIRYFFVGVGSTMDTTVRERLFTLGIQQGFIPVHIIHPSATVSPSAELGAGVTVLAG